MRDRKWLGRDKVRCLILHEKGEKAEEKVNEFVLQSGLKRVVLIISYEVPPHAPLSPRCTAATPTRSTAARRDCSCATRATDSSPPPATPPSTVCASSPRSAACCCPARPSRTTWRLLSSRALSVGALRALRVRQPCHLPLAGVLPTALRAPHRGGQEEGVHRKRAEFGQHALGRSARAATG